MIVAIVACVVAAVLNGCMVYVVCRVKDHPGMWRTPYDR